MRLGGSNSSIRRQRLLLRKQCMNTLTLIGSNGMELFDACNGYNISCSNGWDYKSISKTLTVKQQHQHQRPFRTTISSSSSSYCIARPYRCLFTTTSNDKTSMNSKPSSSSTTTTTTTTPISTSTVSFESKKNDEKSIPSSSTTSSTPKGEPKTSDSSTASPLSPTTTTTTIPKKYGIPLTKRDLFSLPSKQQQQQVSSPPPPPPPPQEQQRKNDVKLLDIQRPYELKRLIVKRSTTTTNNNNNNSNNNINNNKNSKNTKNKEEDIIDPNTILSLTTNTTTTDAPSSSSKYKYGTIINRRYRLEHEITDSNGTVIWIPPSSSSSTSSSKHMDDGTTSVSSNNETDISSNYSTKRSSSTSNDNISIIKLPQMNVSSILDPNTYCRTGGRTIAGTIAARQLLRGKKDFMDIIGHVLYHNANNINNNIHPTSSHSTVSSLSSSSLEEKARQQEERYKAIVLHGHGIPIQLLQYHIDSADHLLRQLHASEVSFKQFNNNSCNSSNNSTNTTNNNNTAVYDTMMTTSAATAAVQGIQYGHVRDIITGENRIVTWPILDTTTDTKSNNSHGIRTNENNNNNNNESLNTGRDWEYDLQLYWTVMNRIATRLGLPVLQKRPSSSTSTTTTGSIETDLKSTTFQRRRPRIDYNLLPNEPSGSNTYMNSTMMLNLPPHHWKVTFTRERYFPPEQLPNSFFLSKQSIRYPQQQPPRQHHQQQQYLYPIIEWTPLDGLAAPGHVCIRLQGVTSSSSSSSGRSDTKYSSNNNAAYENEERPISLCFDASFRSNIVPDRVIL